MQQQLYFLMVPLPELKKENRSGNSRVRSETCLHAAQKRKPDVGRWAWGCEGFSQGCNPPAQRSQTDQDWPRSAIGWRSDPTPMDTAAVLRKTSRCVRPFPARLPKRCVAGLSVLPSVAGFVCPSVPCRSVRASVCVFIVRATVRCRFVCAGVVSPACSSPPSIGRSSV